MKYLMVVVAAACAAAASPGDAAETAKIAPTQVEYVKKARAELDELGGKIDALARKAKDAGVSSRDGMDRELKDLTARRKTAKKRLAKLRRASGQAWSDLAAGVDRSILDLKEALDEAIKNGPS